MQPVKLRNHIMPKNRLFSALAQLRSVARTLEMEMGLENLSKADLDVLCAIIQISNADARNTATTTQILDHPLVQQIGRSTVYRTITTLEELRSLTVIKRGHNAEYALNLPAA